MKQLGPYQILRKLGAGGTAEVFLATGPNPRNRELLALKVVLPHLAEEDGLRAMMIQEARMSALLLHPNVVEVYEVGEVEGRPFLAMEFIAGWSLSTVEKKLRAKEERLAVEDACAIVREAALGLHYAHEALDQRGRPQGLIHRDVSPQNIMLSQDGHVKVVDFGLAKATNAQGTRTGGIKGKLPYMPPEQLRSHGMDRRVDVFALGAVLWELCCGRLLYPGRGEAEIIQQALSEPQPRADEVAPHLPAELVGIIHRTVDRDLAARTPTALALAEALEPFVLPDSAERLAKWASRHFDPMPRTAGDALGLPPTPESQPILATRTAHKATGERALSPRIKARMDMSIEAKIPSTPHLPRVTPMAQKLVEPEEEPEETPAAPEPPPRSRTKLLVGAGAFVLAVLLIAGARGLSTTESRRREDVKPQALSPKGAHAPAGAHGTLVLESDVPAIVRENGAELGKTPLTVSMLAGDHHLSLQTVDMREQVAVDVTVPEQGRIVRRVELESP
ncbi:MAG TPA: serine/threonine-protein kinase [Myxococcaceae bacterium]|nr:serine/threonine-protein kinase [Myxococcaceae bacterium]